MILYGDKLSFRESMAVVVAGFCYTTLIVACIGLPWWWLHDPGNTATLAPEQPLVLPVTIPELDQLTAEATTPTSKALDELKSEQRDPAPVEELTLTSKALDELKSEQRDPAPVEERTRVNVAVATRATARPEDLIEDADDLVFNPANYEGHQVAIEGRVAHLFWNYRLIAEVGQNSIVIDIDGLSQTERVKLEAAIDKAGFLGQVQARIKGTVERRPLATFQLAATHLSLAEAGPRLGSTSDLDGDNSLVVPLYPGKPFGQSYLSSDLTRSGERDQRASFGGRGSTGGASEGASGGGRSEGASGGTSSGSSGGSGNGNSGNGNSGNGNSGNGNSGNGNGNSGNGNSGNGNSGNGNSGNGNSGKG